MQDFIVLGSGLRDVYMWPHVQLEETTGGEFRVYRASIRLL